VTHKSGRHFLQLPGPTNVPDRVLRALARPIIDHRGPAFRDLALALQDELHWVFGTQHPVLVYPSSATGAWEAALANTLSPGDTVVAFDQGFFASKWAQVAARFGLEVRLQTQDPRKGVDPNAVDALLRSDPDREIKALLVVHNETSTGVTTDVEAIGRVVREAGHPALLMVDAVSSLASIELRHDAWGVHVTVSGSQKGLMLPPGLSFTALSLAALQAHRTATLPRGYWDWSDQLATGERGFFPYTPATSLLYGLQEALTLLRAEGLDAVFARHRRHAEATRAAVDAWGLGVFAERPWASATVTAVEVPEGTEADEVRSVILDAFDMSLGTGLGTLKGRVFRIGHLGDLNDLTLLGALAGVEMGLGLAGVSRRAGGVQAAMDLLSETVR
jgi:alanine-glyoxylate transaminase/serine-glyoxylate transaminase/serine-pyruvate transaminase